MLNELTNSLKNKAATAISAANTLKDNIVNEASKIELNNILPTTTGNTPMNQTTSNQTNQATVSLRKNQAVSLSKVATLGGVKVILSWNNPTNSGVPYDMDLSLYAVQSNGHIQQPDNKGFIYYAQDNRKYINNNNGKETITLSEDDLGDSDSNYGEEDATLDLENIDPIIKKVFVGLSVDTTYTTNNTLDKISNAKVEIFNIKTNKLVSSYLVDQINNPILGVVVGEFAQIRNNWKFTAMDDQYPEGLISIAQHYGAAVTA